MNFYHWFVVDYLWLIPAGVAVGAVGTLIGAGGGFVLVPLLLLVYPKEDPHIITSISLAVVFFNSLSGSIAYWRMKRIDFKAGLIFLAASIPGAVFGALATSYIPRRTFDGIFGAFMIGVSVWIFTGTLRRTRSGGDAAAENGSNGKPQTYNIPLGAAISVGVGFLSSVLGIGGGIIHVPALVYLLGFPVHTATATSHFILAGMSLTGTVTHIATSAFHRGIRRTLYLSIGALIGAQIGAALSNRTKGAAIIGALSAGLCAMGVRLLLAAFGI